MTKPREKTREELTAEIEEGKKKIRQFENREKIIKQKPVPPASGNDERGTDVPVLPLYVHPGEPA